MTKEIKASHERIAKLMDRDTLKGMCRILWRATIYRTSGLPESEIKEAVSLWKIYDDEWCRRENEEY